MRLFLIAVLTSALLNTQVHAQSKIIKSTWTVNYMSLDNEGKTKGDRMQFDSDGVYELFGQDGKQVESRIFTVDSILKSWSKYEYDGNGNLSKIIGYGKNGDTTAMTNYTYDGSGRKTKWTFAYYGWGLYTEENYTYNASGGLSASENTSGRRTVYRTTKDGKLRDATNYATKSGQTTESITEKLYYDDSERIVKTENFENGQLKSTYTTKYDQYGNKIESIGYNAQNKVINESRWNLTYDVNGNWTKKVFIDNGKASRITERTIVYY